jgi:cell division protease FtsH
MFISKFIKYSTPFFIGYLLLLNEAIEVNKTIQLHTSFLPPSIHSSFHNKNKRMSIKMLAKNDKNNKSKQCIDFFHTGLIGFMNGYIQAPLLTNAVDIQPPIETQTRAIVTRKQADVPIQIRYSQFLDLIQEDRIEKVTFSSDGQRLIAMDTDGIRYRLDALPNDPELLATLTQKMVDLTVLPEETKNTGENNFLSSLLLPGLLFLGFFFLARRGIEGGGFEGLDGMGFAKSSAKIMLTPDTAVSFENVAGCDSAKMELTEIVDFLKQPEKYTEVGAKIPKGCVLEGPPGTGKTLLARAVAGEAGVPFISASGSEFVEMFVGVGASRVRDIFDQAKKNAPCIIFIDEIDAVGRQRGGGNGGMSGGNDEREQTLNQMLTEMDGFDGNTGIIVMAATNRADVLDAALLRPGRFDRRVLVDLPDFKGRIAILKVHSKGKPLSQDVDIETIARRTPGFSGASLQNILNEAAISAARRGEAEINWVDVDSAVDRILVGLEKKSGDLLSRQELVAYHEAGHALVGALIPDYDQVQKITIIPRSNGAGGLTFFAPSEERLEGGLYSRQYLEAQLAVALGGRLAEELLYGKDEITSGASNDIQQVGNIARRMVTQFGMSDKLGPIFIDETRRSIFQQGSVWSAEIMKMVDEEVERLVSNAYLLAKEILSTNMVLLQALAERLIEQETVTAEEFAMMLVEYKAKTVNYDVYGKSKVSSLPYDSSPNLIRDVLRVGKKKRLD